MPIFFVIACFGAVILDNNLCSLQGDLPVPFMEDAMIFLRMIPSSSYRHEF